MSKLRFEPEVSDKDYVNFDDEWEDDDDCEWGFADQLVQPRPINLPNR